MVHDRRRCHHHDDAAAVVCTGSVRLVGNGVALLDVPALPPASEAGVAALIDVIRAGAPAATPVAAVTDTVKRIDPAGRILSTVDRQHLRHLRSPYAVNSAVLRRLWGGRPDALFTLGVDVAVVPAP